jgi:hypothetical protein
MASNDKGRTVSGEEFPLRFIVMIGTLDPRFWITPESFESRLQHQGCTGPLISVQGSQAVRLGSHLPNMLASLDILLGFGANFQPLGRGQVRQVNRFGGEERALVLLAKGKRHLETKQ